MDIIWGLVDLIGTLFSFVVILIPGAKLVVENDERADGWMVHCIHRLFLCLRVIFILDDVQLKGYGTISRQMNKFSYLAWISWQARLFVSVRHEHNLS